MEWNPEKFEARFWAVSSPNVQVACPTCRKRGAWFEGKFGPFCSHRCKLVDLGKWFGEEHAISEPLKPEHFAGYENLPPGSYLDEPEAGDEPKN